MKQYCFKTCTQQFVFISTFDSQNTHVRVGRLDYWNIVCMADIMLYPLKV